MVAVETRLSINPAMPDGPDFTQWLANPARPPMVMGILNATPDSFSDGGNNLDPAQAIAHAKQLIADGADLLDIGGESTRPGSIPVEPAEQIRRVIPIIEAIASLGVPISIDTGSSEVAERALAAGAVIVNDIYAGRADAWMFSVVAEHNAAIILMHMQGTPATMHHNPTYGDVVAEVREFLAQKMLEAIAEGIEPTNILLDPGIGFGKTVTHDLTLLRRQRELAALGRPLVVGVSRKSFIEKVTGETLANQSNPPAVQAYPPGAKPLAPMASNRLFGTAGAVAWAIFDGASIVRVHDVAPIARVVRMIRAIAESERTADERI